MGTGRTKTKQAYNRELLEFEPKVRSMVRNCRRLGWRFDGYDEDDLVQELFVKGLEVQDRYDPTRAALRTFLYRCFRNKLLKMARSGNKAMALLKFIGDDNVLESMHPIMIEDSGGWRTRASSAVEGLFGYLEERDPNLHVLCLEFLRFEGDKQEVLRSLGLTEQELEYRLTRLRSSTPYLRVLEAIPF